MKNYQIALLLFISLSINSCRKLNEDPKFPNIQLKYVNLNQSQVAERYVVGGPFDPFVRISNITDAIKNLQIRPYYDTVFENSRVQTIHFKDDIVTIEKYSNGIISNKEDFVYTNTPNDFKIYKSDPLNPLYRGSVGLNDTIGIIMLMAYTFKGQLSLKNIKGSVYLTDSFLKNSFVDSAISDFNLSIGDTLYLQQIYLKYAPE